MNRRTQDVHVLFFSPYLPRYSNRPCCTLLKYFGQPYSPVSGRHRCEKNQYPRQRGLRGSLICIDLRLTNIVSSKMSDRCSSRIDTRKR